MSFFLPSRLVDFEYLGGEDSEEDFEYKEIAKPFSREMDFAFFVVNFGYTKKEYEELTETEKAFIMKAWENKIVSDNTHLNLAVFNAIENAFRKKGRPYRPLFKKLKAKADKDKCEYKLNKLIAHEKENGKSWVEKVYKLSGKIKIKGG